ncbi:hypothetical protein CEXT_334341 [Caerostris extrusa]|uniref:Uncharacterized protein n=1 Tax=Caerostris extrusa TaxID=172846 RepID=A0AAV4QC15_CAEEX|nr:hypothetical protein CEXT_334341 [Caerostris extrusa]
MKHLPTIPAPYIRRLRRQLWISLFEAPSTISIQGNPNGRRRHPETFPFLPNFKPPASLSVNCNLSVNTPGPSSTVQDILSSLIHHTRTEANPTAAGHPMLTKTRQSLKDLET